MFGRTIFRVVAALLLVAVAIGMGSAVYNAGVTAGLAEAAQQAAASGDPAPVIRDGWGYAYGYGGPYWHGPFGFGLFGILFWILGILLVIGLVRAAVGGGWRGGRGPGGPGGWSGRGEEWHRELHRREGSDPEQRASGA